MNRRNLLLATPALLVLAACQNGATPQDQLRTNAALVTAGVAAVAASVLATPGLAQDTKDKITNALATVNAANDVIQKGTIPTGDAAQQFVAAIKVAVAVMLPLLSASSPEAIAIQAALALLPTILTAAGVPQAPSAGEKPMMAPAQAVLVLKGYTGK